MASSRARRASRSLAGRRVLHLHRTTLETLEAISAQASDIQSRNQTALLFDLPNLILLLGGWAYDAYKGCKPDYSLMRNPPTDEVQMVPRHQSGKSGKSGRASSHETPVVTVASEATVVAVESATVVAVEPKEPVVTPASVVAVEPKEPVVVPASVVAVETHEVASVVATEPANGDASLSAV